MLKFSTLSPIKRIAILCGLMLLIFLVGGLVGYLRGLFSNDGNTVLAIDWAWKTGLLWILLLVISIVFSRIERFLEVSWQLPFLIGFPLTMGFIFAIINGCEVLMKISLEEFWSSVFSGFIVGFLGGGIGAFLIQKTENQESHVD